MKKIDLLFLACCLVFAVLLLSHSFSPTNIMALTTEDEIRSLKQQSSGKPRSVDSNRIQSMIDRGKLSNHEALFYSTPEQTKSN